MVTPYEAAAAVVDPELRVVTIAELGILRDVSEAEGRVRVTITPTYSGCPAMDAIARDIAGALAAQGFGNARVTTQLAPAWTTDWLNDSARAKLAAYGVAPPERASSDKRALLGGELALVCPRCGSQHTERISEFGSTACKALYRCLDCLEPFDYFKCV